MACQILLSFLICSIHGERSRSYRYTQSDTFRYEPFPFLKLHVGMVQPRYLVEEGPLDLVEQASTWLPCMYEKNTYRSHRKDGCLQTILPECGMHVKRAKRAGKYCKSWNEAATLQM